MVSSAIMLGVLTKQKPRRAQFVQSFLLLRRLTAQAELGKKPDFEIQTKKRFAVSRKSRNLLPYEDSFVADLFAGVFDKKILQYPSPLENEEIDSLLQHSAEIENYLRNFSPEALRLTSNILSNLKNLELFGITIPQKYGGLGYTEAESYFIQECLNMNTIIGKFIAFNENFGTKILTLHGSEEQKLKYLPRLASGESIISFAYLEDSPLVDLKSQNTLCYFDEGKNSFVINGSKKWVHNANLADLIVVLTKRITSEEHWAKNIFQMFLIDKNAPGVTVHECKYGNAVDFNLCEVELKEVSVPKDRLIGNDLKCAHSILKQTLSFGQLGASISCLCRLKKILHSALQHSEEKIVEGQPLKEDYHVKGHMGDLTICTYVLESVVYLISGRFDTFKNPDLFLETNIAKALAVELLNSGITKCLEIFGIDSYKSQSLLREAFKVYQLHSVLDESQLQLKLMIGSAGIVHASQSSEALRDRVHKMRLCYKYPFESFFLLTTSNETRIKRMRPFYKLKLEVHSQLTDEANILEECIIKLNLMVEQHLRYFGNDALKQEDYIMQLGEVAIHIYALTACISRASNSYCNYVGNSDNEVNIVKCFAKKTKMKVDSLFESITSSNEFYRYIGQKTFNNKQYPAEHPLYRSF